MLFLGLFIGAGIGVVTMALLTQGKIADLERDKARLAERLAAKKRGEKLG